MGSTGGMAEDVNRDGVVNAADLAEVVTRYGSATCWSAGSAGPDNSSAHQKCLRSASRTWAGCVVGVSLITLAYRLAPCAVLCGPMLVPFPPFLALSPACVLCIKARLAVDVFALMTCLGVGVGDYIVCRAIP